MDKKEKVRICTIWKEQIELDIERLNQNNFPKNILEKELKLIERRQKNYGKICNST